jgi:hypothetical protein
MITTPPFQLPKSNRWTPGRKAIVVRDINYGKITFEQALKLYHLTEAELQSWVEAFKEHGIMGLRTTRRPLA